MSIHYVKGARLSVMVDGAWQELRHMEPYGEDNDAFDAAKRDLDLMLLESSSKITTPASLIRGTSCTYIMGDEVSAAESVKAMMARHDQLIAEGMGIPPAILGRVGKYDGTGYTGPQHHPMSAYQRNAMVEGMARLIRDMEGGPRQVVERMPWPTPRMPVEPQPLAPIQLRPSLIEALMNRAKGGE